MIARWIAVEIMPHQRRKYVMRYVPRKAGGCVRTLHSTSCVKQLSFDYMCCSSGFCSPPDERGAIEIRNRLRAAWGKFHQHRRWLLNRHVSLHLRLRLFVAVVSPCALFAVMVLPLTKRDLV